MTLEARRSTAQQASGGAPGGLALASDTLTAAFLIGLPGAIFAWGYDGLSFVLGLTAGGLLLQLLVARRLAAADAPTLWDFLNKRYRCRVVRVLAAAAIALSMTVLLVALLMTAGVIGARLVGVDVTPAVVAAAFVVLAGFIVRQPGWRWPIGAGTYLLVVAALLGIALVLSVQWYGLPLPQLAYANALWQIQGIEEALLEQELADPAAMKPMLAPFMTLNALSFSGVVLGLATGVAALPSVVAHVARGTVLTAQRTALWGLVLVVVAASLAPALAAYARLALVTLVSDQTAVANLPQWVFAYGALGLVEVCGRPAVDAAAAVAACASLPDEPSALRLQDIAISSDILVVALPEMTGLGPIAFAVLASAGLLAALLTALPPLDAGVRAVVGAASGGKINGSPAKPRTYAPAAVMLGLATFAAISRPASIVEVAAIALILAAASLFPALIGGLWWRGANAAGAVAAIVVGLGLAVFYLVGTRYFPVTFFDMTSGLSGAGEYGLESFVDLKQAWLAAEGADKAAAWSTLEQHARDISDWWGIAPLAVALIALPAGFLALIVGSFVKSAVKPLRALLKRP